LPIRAALHREQCDSELIETRKENEVLSLFWSKYNAFNGAKEEEQFKSEYWKDFHPKNLLIALRYASCILTLISRQNSAHSHNPGAWR